MRAAGATTEDAMQVTGHQTAGMFTRYSDIFNDVEKQAIQRRVQERRAQWREWEFKSSIVTRDTLPN